MGVKEGLKSITTRRANSSITLNPHTKHRRHRGYRHGFPVLTWFGEIGGKPTYVDRLPISRRTVLGHGVSVRVAYGVFEGRNGDELIELYQVQIQSGAGSFVRYRLGVPVEGKSASFCRMTDRDGRSVTGWYSTVGEPALSIGEALPRSSWPRMGRVGRGRVLRRKLAEDKLKRRKRPSR